MSLIKISPSEVALFNSLRDKIISYDQDGFYDELLYKGGSHLVNKSTDDLKSLLLYAIAANNSIAFDVLFAFGFRWDEESAALIQQQLANMISPLAPEIYDRLIDLHLSHYFINNDLKFSKPDNKVEDIIDDHCHIGNLEINLAPLGDRKYQFKQALIAITNIPEIAELVSQAFNRQPFQVALVPSEHLYSEGECNYVTKTVRVANNLSIDKILTTMVFELCNAINTPLSRLYASDYRTADDFALASERLEYQSHLNYIRFLQKLVTVQDFFLTFGHQGMGIRASIQQEIDHTFSSFDDYWEVQNDKRDKAYSHSEYYRIFHRQYQQLCGYQAPMAIELQAIAEPIPESISEQPTAIAAHALETNLDPMVSDLLLVTDHTPSLIIESCFTSLAAKSFLDIIKNNAAASAIIVSFEMSMAQNFANKIDENKLNVFRRMNAKTQCAFLESYALKQQLHNQSVCRAKP